MNFTSNEIKNNSLLDSGQLFAEVKYGINTYASGRGYSCVHFYCLFLISFRLHPPRGITQKLVEVIKTYGVQLHIYSIIISIN